MDPIFENITNVYSTELPDFWQVYVGRLIEGYSVLVMFIIGIIGNILSIRTLIYMSRFNSTNLYLINLAAADLTLCIFAQLLRTIPKGLTGYDTVTLHPITCKMTYLIHHSATAISGWTLVVVTIERTAVVYFPLKAKSISTVTIAKSIILFLDLFFPVIHLHYIWSYGRKYVTQDDEKKILVSHCTISTTNPILLYYMKNIRTWVDLWVRSLGPFLCLIICNCLIIYKLLKERKDRKSLEATVSDQNKQDSMKSITAMLLTVSFVHLLCISPIQIMYVVYGSGPDMKIQTHQQAMHAFNWSMVVSVKLLNHSINFILYVISGHQFRNALREMLIKTCCTK